MSFECLFKAAVEGLMCMGRDLYQLNKGVLLGCNSGGDEKCGGRRVEGLVGDEQDLELARGGHAGWEWRWSFEWSLLRSFDKVLSQ